MNFAVHQPNYAPWAGYFAKMRHVDVFVFLDDVQLPQGRSYVTRTRVRSGTDARWLTVPVSKGGRQRIMDVRIADRDFAQKHLRALQVEYGRTPHHDEAMALIEPVYAGGHELLHEFNEDLIVRIAAHLGIEAEVRRSSAMDVDAMGDERILEIGRRLGADSYLSGPGGQNYQRPEAFAAAGMELDVREYRPVAYEQLQGEWLPGLTMLDALFHLGAGAADVLRYDDP